MTICKVRVRIGNNEIEVEGDRDFVTETYQDFKNGFVSVEQNQIVEYAQPQDLINSIKNIPQIGMDTSVPALATYLREKGAKSHADKVLAIAAYLYLYKGIRHFTKTDIEEQYKNAMLSKPKNFNDVINGNRRKGFVDLAGEKKDDLKVFHITDQGLAHIESLGQSNSKGNIQQTPLAN